MGNPLYEGKGEEYSILLTEKSKMSEHKIKKKRKKTRGFSRLQEGLTKGKTFLFFLGEGGEFVFVGVVFLLGGLGVLGGLGGVFLG